MSIFMYEYIYLNIYMPWVSPAECIHCFSAGRDRFDVGCPTECATLFIYIYIYMLAPPPGSTFSLFSMFAAIICMVAPPRTTFKKFFFIKQRKTIDSERPGERGSREEIH